MSPFCRFLSAAYIFLLCLRDSLLESLLSFLLKINCNRALSSTTRGGRPYGGSSGKDREENVGCKQEGQDGAQEDPF